jgi:hypothetical protein
MDILEQDIMYLAGVGPHRKKILGEELGIKTFGDLLEYYPYKYVDRSKFYAVRELSGEMPFVQVVGQILSFEKFEMGPRKLRVVAHFSDGTGVMDLVWFNYGKAAMEKYRIGKMYVVFGRPAVFNNRIQVVHPELDELSEQTKTEGIKMQPYYNTTEKMKKAGMTSRAVEKLVRTLLEKLRQPLAETLPDYLEGRIAPVPQDGDKATYEPMLDKSMGEIDWNRPASEIACRVRGLNPWPCAYTDMPGGRLKLYLARAAQTDSDAEPGTVIASGPKEGLFVKCGEGALEVLELQAPGGKRMAAKAYLAGKRIEVGTKLGRIES